MKIQCRRCLLQKASHYSTTQQPLYTTFSPRQKRLLIFLLGLTAITSPLTATIYFPLLPLLASDYYSSAQAINLTITIYVIFQAVSPAIFASLSDLHGRRLVYLLALTLYVSSNLGLALEQKQNSYVALVILRALQSLGASAAFALTYGVIADVCVPAERGQMVGPVTMALNVGTCIGPIVGGWVAFSSGHYVWVFWFLVIVGTLLLVAVAGFLPETARNVVGNGSVEATRWWERTWGVIVWDRGCKILRRDSGKDRENKGRERRSERDEGTVPSGAKSQANGAIRRHRIRNALACLRIIFWKDAAQILWMHGSFYMVDYSIQTSIPSLFKDLYQFNELKIGLSYLPRGAGILVGGYANGKLMDRNYRITANHIGYTIDRDHDDDLNHFPIERARTRGSWSLLGVFTGATVGYGWALDSRSHVSIPLILQFIQGFFGTSIYTLSNTLLVDVFPETPSAAAAAAAITRCAMAALGVALVDPLIGALGRGWYFTTLVIVTGGLSLIAVWMIRTWGMKWRGERVSKTVRAFENDDSVETRSRDPVTVPREVAEKKLASGIAGDVASEYRGGAKP